MISSDNADWLERPFEEAKIYGVIQTFNGDKSPGPDGFPMAFFQACLGIFKPGLMVVFHHFFAKGQFDKSLNATFMTLIPKKKMQQVKSGIFAPLVLFGGGGLWVYKIIAKVMATQLHTVMEDIISTS